MSAYFYLNGGMIMEMTIGANIKRLRSAKNITQEQLSVAMNVTCAAVSKWARKWYSNPRKAEWKFQRFRFFQKFPRFPAYQNQSEVCYRQQHSKYCCNFSCNSSGNECMENSRSAHCHSCDDGSCFGIWRNTA